jgi:E3 ubiquitin-protein ligase BAH
MAKAICFNISEGILNVIPQLADYLCPICLSISYKPVRLRCGHVFCIRCLVVMQRARQDHCPLCRGQVVMEASSRSLSLHTP